MKYFDTIFKNKNRVNKYILNTFLYLYTISMVLEANSYWSFSVQLLQWTHNLKRKIKLRNKNFITNYISITILNITLEGLSFVKCYAHSSDVYRNCIKMNLFAIISIKKKRILLMKSVFRSQTIVSVLCFTCTRNTTRQKLFQFTVVYLWIIVLLFSSFNQCKIRLYTCIQFQCICNM